MTAPMGSRKGNENMIDETDTVEARGGLFDSFTVEPMEDQPALECSVFLGPWFLVVSGCVFAASQLVFDLVGGAVAER